MYIYIHIYINTFIHTLSKLMACGVLHVLKSNPAKDLTTTLLLVNLTLAGAAATEEASGRLAKNGRIAGRKRAGGRWDADKRDGGHRPSAVRQIRGRRSQQRPGHIIHKPTLSRPNPPPAPSPPALLSPLMHLLLEDEVRLSGALWEFSRKLASSTFL